MSPSVNPSTLPSKSMYPSTGPSDGPSVSTDPSALPSMTPSLSLIPSSTPSEYPSDSTNPSSDPSVGPSSSLDPTDTPSESQYPSSEPSLNPSISSKPSALVSVELRLITGSGNADGSVSPFMFTFYSINGDAYSFSRNVGGNGQTVSHFLMIPSDIKDEITIEAVGADGWHVVGITLGLQTFNVDSTGIFVDMKPYNVASADVSDGWIVRPPPTSPENLDV
jgi:hypothetical protein